MATATIITASQTGSSGDGADHSSSKFAGQSKIIEAFHATKYEHLCKFIEANNAVPVFGYGSNNVEQLRGRLKDSSLVGVPAMVSNFQRIFGGPNKSWSVGNRLKGIGVASLVKSDSAKTRGSIVLLTPAQVRRLDDFEGVHWNVYKQIEVAAVIYGNGSSPSIQFPCLTYVRVNNSIFKLPSEAYCCAIQRNVTQSFPGSFTLDIRDSALKLHSQWAHPGFDKLTLPAFIYEVGVRKKVPWEMPGTVTTVMDKLALVGIDMNSTPSDVVRQISTINSGLKGQGVSVFSPEVICIMKRLVSTTRYELV